VAREQAVLTHRISLEGTAGWLIEQILGRLQARRVLKTGRIRLLDLNILLLDGVLVFDGCFESFL